jgi:thermitase
MSKIALTNGFTTSRTRIAMALGATLLSMTGVARAADFSDGVHEYARGRILVEGRAGLAGDDLDKILKAHGGKRRKMGQSNLQIVDLPAGANETAIVEKLRRNPALRLVELDRKYKSTLAVNDPYIGSEWHIAKIGADIAWDTTQGAGVTIAILDSGVDGTHPDLAPNMVAGYNMASNNTDTSDVCGHGTAVAGAAAARSNNGTGVASVAGQAKIMPIRIASYDSATGSCQAYSSTIANGITWAADRGARIANVSYGPLAGNATIQSAANYMKSKGGLVFVSAGNNGLNESTTPTTSLIAVSATDQYDKKTSWSTHGAFVSLAAPGASIWTTSKGGSYGGWNGTSFASPVAAGVAALMMAANPSLDGAKIEQALFSSAVDLGAAGRDSSFGYGRVNAAAAVRAVRASVPVADTQKPASTITSPAASSSVSGLATVNVTATDNVGVTRVDLSANGTIVATDATSPFSFSWNSANSANGMVALVATAYDAAGNFMASAPVSVSVANGSVTPTPAPAKDITAPVSSIDNPVAGTVSGIVAISARATDDSGPAGLFTRLYIDNTMVGQGYGGVQSYSWNTALWSTGTHTIQFNAADAAGNWVPKQVTVTVVR